ncbi:MAG: type IV pilus secretin PilQ [Myxococcota bacterium]
MIRSVEIEGAQRGAEVSIRGAFDVPDYAIRSRNGGRVVVVDVEGGALPDGGVQTRGSHRVIARTVATTTSQGVRIELMLTRPFFYRATAEPGSIRIRLEGEAVESEEEGVHSGPAQLDGVMIERRDGRERVVLKVQGDLEFRVRSSREGPALLNLEEVVLSEGLARTVRGRPGGVIREVRVLEQGEGAVVEVDRDRAAVGTAIRERDRIVWLFAPRRGDRRPQSRTVARERFGLEEAETGEVAAFLTDIPLQLRVNRERTRYSGRRIDLDFKDADIHNILRLLAEVGGVNVVTSDDVRGTVTIRMRNVPWDQALDVILQAKGLGLVRRGNLIRVAPAEVLENEREAAIALQKQRVALAPLETRLVPVSYGVAEDLRPRAAELLSSRGSVSVDERTNVMIVRDITENLDDIEELVRTLDTQTPQVLIEARVVEATSSYSRDVGIQWGGNVVYSSATGNPTGLSFPGNVAFTGGNFDANTPTAGLSPFNSVVNPPNFAVNLPAITGTGQGGAIGLTLGNIGGNVNVNVRLSAAEASGTVRIISSPRILTLDNHEAYIAQGTLIPFSQVSAQGVNTAFQEAKLELRVRPHVTSDGSVAMHVKITRDEPDFTQTSTRGDPTILKREAETDLLISDGNTAVIGGIYTRNTGRNLDQVPFFGDIPLLGILFQRRRVVDDRNELLIFLTPRIVNRAEALPE